MKDVGFRTLVGLLVCLVFNTIVYGIDWEYELPIIEKAAIRNHITENDFYLLIAIRISENGPEGTEFGVLHSDAVNTNLDTQAGWCVATIMANHRRFNYDKVDNHFIHMLGERYCPPSIHPLNHHWQDNVKHWYHKFKNYSRRNN